MRQGITEKDKVHEQWYEDAEHVTAATLPEFVRHLTEDYGHDYGTICHAVAAAAIAASYAVEHSPSGGITGFQAGAVMWEFITRWMSEYKDKPLRLVNYANMLYPQHEDKFQKTISASAWAYLQDEAKKLLADKDRAELAHPNVVQHWKSIVIGTVPFGYAVKED